MKNELKYLADFKQVLADYSTSSDTKELLNSVKLVLLSSPSAVGRNTLIKELVKTGEYYFIVSDTTRHPRVNDGVMEQNGVEYWFTPEEEFLDGLKRGDYIEAQVIHNQQVSGVSIREIKKAKQEDKTPITDIEAQGVGAIMSVKPDTKAIFLLPPSFEEWMSRLNNRGEMPDVEKARRLKSAIDEFEFALNADYLDFLVCDNLSDAVQGVNSIASGNYKNSYEKERNLVRELIISTRNTLKNL